MNSVVSVNVGLPRDVEWQGKVVHTAVWKKPVPGRVMARRLNLDGDGQGDLAGHGGEHRAVMVYQLDSYRYWQEQLQRRRLRVRSIRRKPDRGWSSRQRGLHRRPLSNR